MSKLFLYYTRYSSLNLQWKKKSLREVVHQRAYEAWRLGQSEDGQYVKWWSHRESTCSCSSCSSISMVSSNTFSSSALSLMLSTGTSVPLLALHSNGNHDISIFIFVCLKLSLLSSVSPTSSPISLVCLNKNAAYLKN